MVVPDLPATEPLTVDLEAGFNLVAWFGPEGTPVREALASLGESAVRAFGWVAAEQRFKTYDPARAFLTDFETLARGEALWLDMASARQWAQPVAAEVVESADGRLTVEGAAAGVTIAAVSIDALPAELFLPEDGATIVAVYEIGRAGVSGDLQVHYRASDLRTVQAAAPESGTLTGPLPEGPSPGWQTSGDPGLALFTVAVDEEGNSTPSPCASLWFAWMRRGPRCAAF